MLEIYYAPAFVKLYKKLDPNLKSEVKEKIEIFKDPKNHSGLKVHKLEGRLSGRYAFSINYKIRIIFRYGKNKKEVFLLDVGNHNIY